MFGYRLQELVPNTLALLLFTIYHLHLLYEIYKRPEKTLIGISNHMRHSWVESVVEERRDMVAVQTLRNWTMAAVYLASTGVLIWLGMFHLTFTSFREPDLYNAFLMFGNNSLSLWMLQWIILLFNFFFVFVNFTLAIRHYNHVSFMINLPAGKDDRVTVESITLRLNRGATHYTMGMRGYYLAVPLVMWMFSNWGLLLGMIVLLWFLNKIDHDL